MGSGDGGDERGGSVPCREPFALRYADGDGMRRGGEEGRIVGGSLRRLVATDARVAGKPTEVNAPACNMEGAELNVYTGEDVDVVTLRCTVECLKGPRAIRVDYNVDSAVLHCVL